MNYHFRSIKNFEINSFLLLMIDKFSDTFTFTAFSLIVFNLNKICGIMSGEMILLIKKERFYLKN